MVEICPVVLMKIFKLRQCIFAIALLSPFGKGVENVNADVSIMMKMWDIATRLSEFRRNYEFVSKFTAYAVAGDNLMSKFTAHIVALLA